MRLKPGASFGVVEMGLKRLDLPEVKKEAKEAFLRGLRDRGAVAHACEVAGICRATAYNWRKDDEEFAAAWDKAVEESIELLEASVYERARQKDTLAAIFLLKAARPEKYRDRYEHQLTGPGGGPIQVSRVAGLSDEELDKMLEELRENRD